MAEKKMWTENELTCKPLDSYEEIISFIQNPPSWRTLCTELKPHGEDVIRNMDINKSTGPTLVEAPQIFCHFNPQEDYIERHDRKKLPRTLVCHDMANGYHDDSYIDGTGQSEAYTFYNWAGIDVFCYFSHHLITIPPLGWINVGHMHGVQVIGTIITEWGKGATFWDKALSSENEWRTLASALVAIAKTLKFDGWLLNIENKVSRPSELLKFVRHLRLLMRQELPAPLLLWYDSVTVDGQLQWQNGLTDKNRAFFDAADGLFTNYSWSVEDVQRSAALAEAAGRLQDLYVGIDVWGRNFHGGGKFNTKQAVEVAHRHGCSLAVFAPAWTHEARADDTPHGPALEPYEQFLLRERALWGSLWPYLNTHLPTALPFRTSFCRGQGRRRWLYGEVIAPVPWYNLRHQQYQPNSSHGPHGYTLSCHSKVRPGARTVPHNEIAGVHRRSIDAPEADSREDVTLSTKDVTADLDDQNDDDLKRKLPADDQHAMKTPKTEADEEDGRDGGEKPAQAAVKPRPDERSNEVVPARAHDKFARRRCSLASVPHELECLEPFYEDSFIGGSCLKINPSDAVSPEHRVARLLHCDFRCSRLVACVVTKSLPGHECQALDVTLHLRHQGRGDVRVLVGSEAEEGGPADERRVLPLQEGEAFRQLQQYVLLHEPSSYVPVANDFGWKVRYYDVRVGAGRVTAVSCRTRAPHGPILLGYFGLCRRAEP